MPVVMTEKLRRIRLAAWAYAYEVLGESIVDDFTYDKESYAVDLSQATDRPDLDKWFQDNFDPCTGTWIHHHPEIDKVAKLARDLIPGRQRICDE